MADEPKPEGPPDPSRGESAAQPDRPAEELVKPEAPPAVPVEARPQTPPAVANAEKPAEAPAAKPATGAVKPADAAAAKPAAPGAKPAAAAKPATPPPPKPPAVMVTTPWEGELPALARSQFGGQILEAVSYLGQNFFVVQPAAAIPLLELLKLEGDFDYLVDLTAVDWPKRPERFDLIYVLYSFRRNERVRVKTAFAESYQPASAVPVHTTANWLEREVFDMFGIRFAGHPDLRRILMPEEWEGYPLRKDYSILQQDQRWVQENLGIESGQ